MRFFQQRPPFALMVATGACCTVVLLVFARLSYGLVLPAMREGLGLSHGQSATLGTATALGYLLLVMVAGVFAARVGGKQSVQLGLALVIVGFGGLSQAEDYRWMMVLMVVLGMGTAFGYTPLISLLSNTYPKKRGAVIGFTNSGVGIGMLLAGALVPWLTGLDPDDGWRRVWLVFAAAGCAVAFLVTVILRNPDRPLAPDTASATGFTGRAAPVFRNPHVIVVGLIYGVLGLTYIVQVTFMYSYALESGMDATTAGRLVSGMGLLSIFAGPCWGWLSDRLGYSNGLVLSMSLSLLSTSLPVLWPAPWAFAAHFLILGLSVAGLFTSILAACTETVAPHQAPVAVSFVTLFFAVGQFLGPAISGVIIETTDGFRAAFAVSCLVMVGGVWLCWRSRRYQRGPDAGAEAATP